MKNLLFIDFETFYSSKEGYTLKKISMLEYIRSPKFRALGMAYKWGVDGQTHWLRGDHVIRAFVESVDWSTTDIVAQNVKFDGAIIRWVYGAEPRSYIDTLSMSRAVLGCRLSNHSLKTVSEHCGLPAKGTLRTDGLSELTMGEWDWAQLADYCKHDVDLCAEIYRRLAERFPEGQYEVMDWTIRCFIEPSLKLDAARLKMTHALETARRASIFADIGIDKAVFSSNDQFARLLADSGYEVPLKKNKDGKLIPALAVTDSGFLDLQSSGDENLGALCEARVAAKSTLLETRSAKLLRVAEFGLFPFDLNYSGAVNTHRFSGASGAGGNPQNLPRGSQLRAAVSTPDGSALVVADFAAIELRIVAWLAREQKLVETLSDRKGDPYCQFATKIYHREITKADKAERQYGKCAVLGLGYNMGPKKFIFQARSQAKMVIDQDESERVVYLYRDTYPRIPALWETLDHYIPYIAERRNVKLPGMPFLEIKNGEIVLPSGLTLKYPNLRQERVGKRDEWIFDSKGGVGKLYGGKLLENISQALAGEICKVAITRARQQGVKVAGQCHDEILAVEESKSAIVALDQLLDAMEQPIPWWPSLKLFAEGGVGRNWLEAKK